MVEITPGAHFTQFVAQLARAPAAACAARAMASLDPGGFHRKNGALGGAALGGDARAQGGGILARSGGELGRAGEGFQREGARFVRAEAQFRGGCLQASMK